MIGTVNEDFAVESLAGDIFQLGNTSYRILRVERGTVRVEDAKGMAPNIPFWLGEAPGRSDELSQSVSRLRGEIPTGCRPWAPTPPAPTLTLPGTRGREGWEGRARFAGLSTKSASPSLPPTSSSNTWRRHGRRSACCRPMTRSCSSASSTRSAACSSSSIRPMAAASTAPGAWRCASASAASSISSCRRRRPKTTSCCR